MSSPPRPHAPLGHRPAVGPRRPRGEESGFHKINGAQNPADLLTMYLGAGEVEKHVKKLYIEYPSEKEDQNLTIHGLCSGI